MAPLSEEEAFLECNKTVLHKPLPDDGKLYCLRTFDGLMCWDDTAAGERATHQCPPYGFDGFNPRAVAFKDCTANGTWWVHPVSQRPWTNYSHCADDVEDHKQILYLYIAGYSISIFFLLVALGIFFYYKQLQCDRVLIHQHLFISYILAGTVWILSYTLVYLDIHVLNNNPVWCQALHVTTQLFTMCSYFWMFCEGLYLHTIIVTPFSPGTKLMWVCYAVGWGLPVIPIAIYTGIRAADPIDSKGCWIEQSVLQYIVLAPILLSLVVNLVFLINIVRILMTKLRANYTRETRQTRKAVRATFILVPLLGLQYLLVPAQPAPDAPGYNVYKSVLAFVTSFQGFFVSLLFCFLNGEVRNLLERKWRKRLKHQGSSKRSKTSRGDDGRIEMTAAQSNAPINTQEYTQTMTTAQQSGTKRSKSSKCSEDFEEAKIELLHDGDGSGDNKKQNGHALS